MTPFDQDRLRRSIAAASSEQDQNEAALSEFVGTMPSEIKLGMHMKLAMGAPSLKGAPDAVLEFVAKCALVAFHRALASSFAAKLEDESDG